MTSWRHQSKVVHHVIKGKTPPHVFGGKFKTKGCRNLGKIGNAFVGGEGWVWACYIPLESSLNLQNNWRGIVNARSNRFEPHSVEKETKNSDFSTYVNLLVAWLNRCSYYSKYSQLSEIWIIIQWLTYRRTESNAYEPAVQYVHVGSKMDLPPHRTTLCEIKQVLRVWKWQITFGDLNRSNHRLGFWSSTRCTTNVNIDIHIITIYAQRSFQLKINVKRISID